MLTTAIRTALLAAALLAGLPWVRSASAVPPGESAAAEKNAPPVPDRVVLLGAGDAGYRALAIPRSYKSAPDAPLHLLVFHGGLCVRDFGLADSSESHDGNRGNGRVAQETGKTVRAFVAQDASAGVVLRTRYDSRVDLTPGNKSTAGDTVTGDTSVTLVDPTHPNGRWRVTLEESRWAKDVVVLPAGRGVVLTTFLPRTGPADVRILDASGHELDHIAESAGETLRIEASPDGGFAAADVAFRENPALKERGVVVFDLTHGSQWTYGWNYGSDAEPLSWQLQGGGVLAVKTAGGTRRFDATGKKL